MAGEDRRIKIWDLATGSLLQDLKGHTDFVYSLAFNRDGSLLASGVYKNEIIVRYLSFHYYYGMLLYCIVQLH